MRQDGARKRLDLTEPDRLRPDGFEPKGEAADP